MSDDRVIRLGLALRNAREAAGLSQEELARRTGWEDGLLSDLEAGTLGRLPDDDQIRSLDEAVGGGGLLMGVAGYNEGLTPEMEKAIRQAIDRHVEALIEDLHRILGVDRGSGVGRLEPRP